MPAVEYKLKRYVCALCHAVLMGEEPRCDQVVETACFGCWDELSRNIGISHPSRDVTNRMLYPHGVGEDDYVVLGGEA